MHFLTALWRYLETSAPPLLLGFFLAGILRAFLAPEKVALWLGKGKWSDVFTAAAVGVPLPLCSCSVVPTAVTLRQKGASRAATSAFLISTPESGIDSFMVTKALMDWPMTIVRPLAAFLSAFVAGSLQLIFNKEPELAPAAPSGKACCSHDHNPAPAAPRASLSARLRDGMRWAMKDLVDDLAFWMTIGILLGAFLEVAVPKDFFLGLPHWQARIAMLFVGIPLYICASATTPIAASLVAKGLNPGAALILLLTGPATNIGNLLILRKHIGSKAIIINVLAIASVALIAAVALDAWYGGVTPDWGIAEIHHHGTDWVGRVSAIVLSVLLLKGLWFSEILPRLTSHKDCCHT